jgi:phosphatidylserine decarboxylase
MPARARPADPCRWGSAIREWRYAPDAVRIGRGEEMGRFLLGSTVVLLFPHDSIAFDSAWAPDGAVRMGEAMGAKP